MTPLRLGSLRPLALITLLAHASACSNGSGTPDGALVDAGDAGSTPDVVFTPTDAAPSACDDLPDAGYVFCDTFDHWPLSHYWSTFVAGNATIGLATDKVDSAPNALFGTAAPGLLAGVSTQIPVTSSRIVLTIASYTPAIVASATGNVDLAQLDFGAQGRVGIGLSPQPGAVPQYYISRNGAALGFASNSADRWTDVSLVVDMAAQTISLSLNNAGSENIPGFGPGTETTATLSVGVLSNSTGGVTSQWIDNVRVSN